MVPLYKVPEGEKANILALTGEFRDRQLVYGTPTFALDSDCPAVAVELVSRTNTDSSHITVTQFQSSTSVEEHGRD